MNIDLIIQGPVDGSNVFLSKMDVLCKQFNKVIISTWDHEDSGAWIEKLSDYNNVVITSEKLPHRPSDPTGEPYKGIIGCSTYYWACLSTYNGLEKSSADYIIKMRSDEYYEDFSIIKKELRKSSHKFICGNIFYKRTHKGSPYHIGDHIYACKRESIHNGLKIALAYYRDHIVLPGLEKEEDIDQTLNSAEVSLAHIFLIGSGIPRDTWHGVEENIHSTFDKYFKVFDINRLGEYIARWSQPDYTFSLINPYVQSYYDR